MTVAFMGSSHCDASECGGANFWNANVMIEIGSRIASRLPYVLVSDRDFRGRRPEFPLSLSTLNVTVLPGPASGPTPYNWVDPAPDAIVQEIRRKIEIEQKRIRSLDCKHSLASINASSRDTSMPESLLYTAASAAAEDLFGVNHDGEDGQRQLVGRTMAQFLEGIKDRMHPVQWKMFGRNQIQAREMLKNNQTSIANVPIVFEKHDNEALINRAYLPIIVQEFQRDKDGENNWYNIRVLYLNVSTVTSKHALPNGDEYYSCTLDPTSDTTLDPLKPFVGVRAFMSYSRRNYDKVEKILELLRQLSPYVDPFIDLGIEAGNIAVDDIQKGLDSAEVFFVFLDSQKMGPGQSVEVKELIQRALSGRSQIIVPVLLDQCTVPSILDQNEWVKYDELNLMKLQRILVTHFKERCPDEWAQPKKKIGAKV